MKSGTWDGANRNQRRIYRGTLILGSLVDLVVMSTIGENLVNRMHIMNKSYQDKDLV